MFSILLWIIGEDFNMEFTREFQTPTQKGHFRELIEKLHQST